VCVCVCVCPAVFVPPSNKSVNPPPSFHNLLIIFTFPVQKYFSHEEFPKSLSLSVCPPLLSLSLPHNSRLMADSLIVARPPCPECVCVFSTCTLGVSVYSSLSLCVCLCVCALTYAPPPPLQSMSDGRGELWRGRITALTSTPFEWPRSAALLPVLE